MRISAEGNVGIGTSDPNRTLTVSSTSGVPAELVSSSTNSLLAFFDANTGVRPSVGSDGSDLVFNANGERMRIDSSGAVMVGKTSSGLGGDGVVIKPEGKLAVTRDAGAAGQFNRESNDGALLVFYRAQATAGSIAVSGTTTTYNTSSDVRLKRNIVDAPSGNIDDIKIRSFEWKINDSHQKYGVIAQELFEVAPEAVSQGETEEDAWGVDYSKLVPMMIKEIQDLKAEVAALKGA
jgi:hypothetical protein